MIFVVPLIALAALAAMAFSKDPTLRRVGEITLQCALLVFLLWLQFTPQLWPKVILPMFGR